MTLQELACARGNYIIVDSEARGRVNWTCYTDVHQVHIGVGGGGQSERKVAGGRDRQAGRWDDRVRSTYGSLLVGWLLNVPATGECISGTDLLRQFYVLPH